MNKPAPQIFRGPSTTEAASFENESKEKTFAIASAGKQSTKINDTLKIAAKSKPAVQRKSATFEKTDQVQRKNGENNNGDISSISAPFQSSLDASKGSGQKMDNTTNNLMSSKFGNSFDTVKLHNNSRANKMAEEINAKAFTVGDNIYFGKGEYQPNSHQGRWLLAHELTHTMQQKNGETNSVQPFYRKQKTHSGTKNIGPGIKIAWSGKNVTISAEIEVYGKGATTVIASVIESDIKGHWNKTFADGYSIKTKINVKARKKGASAATGRTLIKVEPMTGPSFVSRSWLVGSKYMTLDINDLVWVPAHEFGHLLGLSDKYKESFYSKLSDFFGGERTTKKDRGWARNIMAIRGGLLESKNIKLLLALYGFRYVSIVEDAQNTVMDVLSEGERRIKGIYFRGY